MESMERQLAGLSTLVHSALVSKGMSESSRKDMADLRREVGSHYSYELHFSSLIVRYVWLVFMRITKFHNWESTVHLQTI